MNFSTGPGFEAWVGGLKGDFTYGPLTLTAGYTFNGEDDNWRVALWQLAGLHQHDRQGLQPRRRTGGLAGRLLRLRRRSVSRVWSSRHWPPSTRTSRRAFPCGTNMTSPPTTGCPPSRTTGGTGCRRCGSVPAMHWSTATTPTAATDQLDDFRVILNYELQFNGKDI